MLQIRFAFSASRFARPEEVPDSRNGQQLPCPSVSRTNRMQPFQASSKIDIIIENNVSKEYVCHENN